MSAASSSGARSAGGLAASTVRDAGNAAVWGVGAGIGASLVMAMYAMIAAATYQGTGFFTPLYHIASLWAAPDSMMTSMEAAMGGDTFTFTVGPAILGALIHMMTGAMYGAIFAVIAALVHFRGLLLVVGGLVWGAVVFAFSAWIGLPIAAAIFGSGDPISNMASMAGWGTFFTEHLIFGVVLGLILLGRRVSR